MSLLKDIIAIVGLLVFILAAIAAIEAYTGPDPMFVQGGGW